MFKIAKQHLLLLGLHFLATAYTANVYPSGEKTETEEEAGTQTQWQSSKNCKIDKDSLNRTSPPCIFSTPSSNTKQKKIAVKKEVNLFLGKVEYSEKEGKMLCVYEKNKSSSFVWLHTSIDEEGTKGMESLESFFKKNSNTEDQKESLYDFFNNFTCPDVNSIDEESTPENESSSSSANSSRASSRASSSEDSSSDSSSSSDDDDIYSQQDAFLRDSLDLPMDSFDLPEDSRSSPTDLLKESPIQVHYHREEVKCADNDGESNGDSCLAGAYKIELQVTLNKKKSGTTPAGEKRGNKSITKDTGATLYLTSNEYRFITGPANTKGLAVNIDREGDIVLEYPDHLNIMNDRNKNKLYPFMLTNGKSVASYDNKTLAVGSHFVTATDGKVKIRTESETTYHLTPHPQSLFFCNKNEPTALINIPENNQPNTDTLILSETSQLPQNELPALTKPMRKKTTSTTTIITTTQKIPDINLQRKALSRRAKLNCPWPCSIL